MIMTNRDSVAASYGGWFIPNSDECVDPSQLALHSIMKNHLDVFKNHVDFVSDHAKSNGFKGVDLSCGFIINDNMNAISDTCDDGDIIACFLGLYFGINGSINRIINLGIPEIVIGGGGIPSWSDAKIIPINPIISEEVRGIHWEENPKYGKHDPDMKTLFMKWCFDFIMFHELGHIWNGHLGFMKNEKEYYKLNDFSYMKEVDADYFSGHAVFSKNFNAISDDFLNKSTINALIFLAFASYFTLRLLHVRHYLKEKDGYRDTHPHPSIRIHILTRSIRTALRNVPNSASAEVDRALNRAEQISYLAFGQIGGGMKAMFETSIKNKSERADSLIRKIKPFRESLEPYRRGPFIPRFLS